MLDLIISHFSRKHNDIFHHFEWQVNDHEHWAIIGDIGVGKTTLLKILDGSEYLPKANGQLTLHPSITQKDIVFISFSDEKKWIKRADFYYQQRYYTSFTEEEMTLRTFLAIDTLTDIEQAQTFSLLEKYSLSELLDVPFIQLSNGQKNKSILIKSRLSSSAVLLLDNPFIGIDAISRIEIFGLIDTLIQQGKQVIYTTNYAIFAPSTTHILQLKADKTFSVSAKEDFVTPSYSLPKKKQETVTGYSEEIISLKEVTIVYHQKTILDHINWTVRKGEKWAVIGVNGSGKSTLLSLLYADHPHAYKNDILLFNEPRRNQSIWEIKSRIGYLSSEFHLHFNEPLSVMDTVGTGFFDTLSLLKQLTEEQSARVSEVLSLLRIMPLKNRLFLSLSFGEQRLVLFARAIVKTPELLILDEPYQGLDMSTIQRCNQVLNDYLDYEHTLIFTSHYEEEIPDCINKFLHLANGKIIPHE